LKAIFEFTLPEEKQDYELHANAPRLYSAVWDYAEWLRGVCKHEDPDNFNAFVCRDKLYEILKDKGYEL